MKPTRLFLTACVLFASSLPAFARAWPAWRGERVTEIRCRDAVPGEQVRVIAKPEDIEKLLQALRRAPAVTAAKDEKRTWQVCFDVVGEKPEAGRWLLNLETGDCTFLDPLIQPIHRLTEEDRRALAPLFRR